MNRWIAALALCTAFVLGCVTAQTTVPRLVAEPPPMPEGVPIWHQRCVETTEGPMSDDLLNDFGAKGWEMVGVSAFTRNLSSGNLQTAQVITCFKRPIPQ